MTDETSTEESRAQAPLSVTPERMTKDRLFGFRMEWASGGADGLTFTLDHNASLGGMSLMLTVAQEGKPTVRESINLRPLVEAWVDQIVATTPGPSA